MLNPEDTALVVIDIQEKLFALMQHRERLAETLPRLIKGAKVLGLPVVWAEQYPEGMGPTIPEVAGVLGGYQPISKKSFSLCSHLPLRDAIERTGCRSFLLAGIESHVCVYQTARDLIGMKKEVEVVSDCVSSRTEHDHRIGLDRIRQVGGCLTTLEMALFELMKSSDHPGFKDILPIVK